MLKKQELSCKNILYLLINKVLATFILAFLFAFSQKKQE